MLTDFEIAATKALKRVFPGSNQKYCYFHLRQSIWKHIQQSGFAKRYGKDISFAHKMRHIPALAYLKPEEIRDTFLLLQKKEVLSKEISSIVSWFSKYYVNGTFKNVTNKTDTSTTTSLNVSIQRIPPLFPPEAWSIHDRLELNTPNSQNSVESWHHRWNGLLGRKKWNLFKTIKEMEKEQKNNELIIEKIRAQDESVSPTKKKKQVGKEEKLKKLLNQKEDMDRLDFMNSMAYICHFKK